MSEQPITSNLQQLIFDLKQKLIHSFSEQSTSAEVNINDFKSVFNTVFTGVSDAKLQQIFVSFDVESKETINWYKFLKQEQLPKILLSLHDESISQIAALQDSSAEPQIRHQLSTQSFLSVQSVQSSVSLDVPNPTSPHTNHNTNNTPGNLSITKSLESVISLEQEVFDKDGEIIKLKEWITNKGIPAQKSAEIYEQKTAKLEKRESEMVEEIENYRNLHESLESQHALLQKEHQQLQSQHGALQNEHKSFKALCNEIQMKYDELLELNKKEKEEIKHLTNVIDDLHKLKDQYERVNSDQNNKIDTYKHNMEDLREKCNVFEMYIQDIVHENDTLHQWIHNKQNEEQNDIDKSEKVGRVRALSAVNEDTESKTPAMHISTNTEDIQPGHSMFQPSTTFSVLNFDDISKRYSGHGKRASGLLHRIRNSTMNMEQYLGDMGSSALSINMGASSNNINDSVNMDNNTSMFGGKRRKRTISILSIGGGLRGKMFQPSMGDSSQFMDGADFENDDDGGYADAAYEELGDDFDQIQEITEQLREELQTEMEEELEAQIQNKYDLKIMKLNAKHNEQLMLLNVEIDRLKSIIHHQTKKMKVLALKSGEIPEKTNEDEYYVDIDDQKTNEERRHTMDDDMDDLESNSVDNESDDLSYDDTVSDDDDSSRSNDDDHSNYVVMNKGRKRNRKHQTKDRKTKRKKKKHEKNEEYVKSEISKGGFCCSSLFSANDYQKVHDEDMEEAYVSSGSSVKSSKKRRGKKKKKRKRDKDRKEKSKKKDKSSSKKKRKKKYKDKDKKRTKDTKNMV